MLQIQKTVGQMKTTLGRFVFLVAGVAIGCIAASLVLYNRSGKQLFNRLVYGRKTAMKGFDQYSFGHDSHLSVTEMNGVTSRNAPEWLVRRGLEVERVASGLRYPINMAFVDKPGDDPESPQFYVCELNGAIRYVTNNRSLKTLTEGLLNFTPISASKSSETGISGLTTVPGSPDLIISRAAMDKASGLLVNQIVRLKLTANGRQLEREEILRELPEYTSPSNQIQQVLFGPDGMLYVSVGDAENHRLSLDLEKFGGKILRMTPEGEPCGDNPYFNAALGDAPSQFVFASGVRNVFDFDFHPTTGRLYAVDNGKNIDRLFPILPGARYGWNGDFQSTRMNGLWTWGPVRNAAPVGIAILKKPVLGSETALRCYVACYGPPGVLGKTIGKSIMEFVLDPTTGLLKTTPVDILRYQGTKQATVLGLAEGPDGLYFTDFFGEADGTPDSAVASIWRVFHSDSTLYLEAAASEDLENLKPHQRGERVFFRFCTQCHTMDGFGGNEGPNLTHAGIELDRRLSSVGYAATVRELMTSEHEFRVNQRPRLKAVLDATKGPERFRVWLRHHIEEPRFDNPFAKMPSFLNSLSSGQIEDVIEYLATRAAQGTPRN